MTETSKYIKYAAFAFIVGGIIWATVQSGGIRSLNGNMIVSFNQDRIADDLGAIQPAAGQE